MRQPTTKNNQLEEEKAGLLLPTDEPSQLPVRYTKPIHILKALAAVVIFLTWWSYSSLPLKSHEIECLEKDKQWEDIVSSERLEWHPCFSKVGPFKCARLTVPMDYHRSLNASSDNAKVHIALTMLPGKHSSPRKFSISPLLLNPGGPGGSGVGIVLGWVERLHKMVREEQDVIGFDPRGIGATTPRADCYSYPYEDSSMAQGSLGTGFEENYARGNFHRLIFGVEGKEAGIVNSCSEALQKIDTRAKTVAKLCAEKDSILGRDSILKYAHTPSVARDMISIIDAWDEWTDNLSRDLLPSEGNSLEELEEEVREVEGGENDSQGLENDYDLDTKGKLVYWGFSYGALLGATFASMFPDRVGRGVLDGVVDADHYVGPVWVGSIQDTDKIIEAFTNSCVISYGDIKRSIFTMLYAPMMSFPGLARVVDLLYRGKGDILEQLLAPLWSLDLQPVCAPPRPAYMYPDDAQIAIMCSDKRYPLNQSLSGLELMYEDLANSSSFADVWMTVMLGCSGYSIEAVDPPMRWDNHPAHKAKPIKTSYPLLFISNSRDPVTPLASGLKMARKFVDSGLVEQESEGHCSIGAVSKCTIDTIRAYLNEGKVPPHPIPGEEGRELVDGKWKRCTPDEWPWHPYNSSEMAKTASMEEREEVQRMGAAKEMQETSKELKFFGHNAGLGLDLYE